jgi:hypothetical protein
MIRSSYRAVVHGGRIVLLDGDNPLPEGTRVLVTPMGAEPGTPAAIVAALDAAPKVPKEWVDELERLIREGERPPLRGGVFAEEQGEQENR